MVPIKQQKPFKIMKNLVLTLALLVVVLRDGKAIHTSKVLISK